MNISAAMYCGSSMSSKAGLAFCMAPLVKARKPHRASVIWYPVSRLIKAVKWGKKVLRKKGALGWLSPRMRLAHHYVRTAAVQLLYEVV